LHLNMLNNYLLQIYIMPFSSYIVSTSNNIIWSGANAKLSNTDVTDPDNFSKLLYNNNGEIDYVDDNMYKEIQAYPTVASFPAVGDKSKYYLDQSDNKLYRYAESQYFYVPYDVYSKAETDAMYRLKTDSYTKTEVDTKDATLQTNINTVSTNLTTETTNRTNADLLRVPYTGATSAVNLGSQNLTTTGNVTAANITTISTNLATETTNRTNADALLVPYTGATGAVNLGAQNLTTTGNVTATNITTISTNLASEVTNRTNADALLIPYTGATTNVNLGVRNLTTTGNVTATNITTISNDLATETTNRTNADALLVPYTGASSAVNLGSQNLTTTGGITSATGTITTLASTTATIPTLKATNIQNASGTNVATISAQNYLDIYGTSTSTGGIRFGAGKTPRETNEGKIFYNAAQGNLMIIGCNNDGTYTTDNNIRLADNVSIDNTLTVSGTSTLAAVASGNTTITGTCSVSGTTTLGTANITTASVSGTASCGNVTCTGNLIVGGNMNTIPVLNYTVSDDASFTIASNGIATKTYTVPTGKLYRIISAQWRTAAGVVIGNADTQTITATTAALNMNFTTAMSPVNVFVVLDRNGP
jgi:mRNA-degrading endonuclease toxin of MazEF toxin-antitoxin module